MVLDFDGRNFTFQPDNYTQDKLIRELVQGKWDKSRRLWVLPDLKVYPLTLVEAFSSPNYPHSILTQEAIAQLQRSYEWIPSGWLEYREATQYREQFEKLYLYQQEEVVNLVENPKKGQMVVLSPGLGKTIVSLLAANILNCQRVLII